MELKKGYKKTDIGQIPIDWLLKWAADIGSIKKGKGIKRTDILHEGLPCIRYGEIYTKYDNYVKAFDSFISISLAPGCQAINTGDIHWIRRNCGRYRKMHSIYGGRACICGW